MDKFKAFRITQVDKTAVKAEFVECGLDDLDAGQVVIKVAYSDVNYKDALAATGKGRILLRPSCIGGIDLSGTVVSSSDARFAKGDAVLGVGHEIGVKHDGGYAGYARLPADWVVKLIDVFPDDDASSLEMSGYELMVSADIFRGRYRESYEVARPLEADQVLDYTLPLPQVDHTFQPGHRLMVQVQSTWFPLYDRNPQTFVPNIFEARAGDFRAQTHRIYRSAQYPSHLELDVLGAAQQ